MEYNLQGVGVELSSEVRSYLDKKLAHTEKLLTGISTHTLDIHLVHESGAAATTYQVSFKLLGNKKTIYAKAEGATLHEAIDITAAEFDREAARFKKKELRSLRSHAARIKDFFRGFRQRP